jgi:peptide deformylase
MVERGPEVTARRIVQAPEAVLRRKARRVRAVDARVRALAQDLIDSLPPHGVGLAAPQIGVSLQVAIVKLPEDEAPTVLVNPKVVRRQGEREIGEGCLSLEGYEGVVTRSSKVRVRATDLNGKEIRIKAADDLLAQALEHEIDHLDGVLYVDHLVSEDALTRLDEPDSDDPDGRQSGEDGG